MKPAHRLAPILSILLWLLPLPARAADNAPGLVRDVEAAAHTLAARPPAQPDTVVEPAIAVNPVDHKNAVAVFQEGRVPRLCAQTNGYATTFDGGRSWSSAPLPGLSIATGGEFERATDPSVAFGPDNTVYAASMLCFPDFGVGVNVSRDGGRTWDEAVVAYTEVELDKPWIVVDNGTGMGHHPGRVYLAWTDSTGVVAAYSDDQGETWHGPYNIQSDFGIGAIPLVLPSGDLAVVYNSFSRVPVLPPSLEQWQADSVDAVSKHMIAVAARAGSIVTGGVLVFSAPLAVATFEEGSTYGFRVSSQLPSPAVDAVSGRIYVVWSDVRFAGPGSDIVLVWSSDSGRSWSRPVRVNPASAPLNHFTPALAVGDDGSVRIAYRVQRISSTEVGMLVDTFYQESFDQGRSFSAPLKINQSVRTDGRFAAHSRGLRFLGDYSQIAPAGELTYVIRCEAYRPRGWFGEPTTHQRAWVAIVRASRGSYQASGSPQTT